MLPLQTTSEAHKGVCTNDTRFLWLVAPWLLLCLLVCPGHVPPTMLDYVQRCLAHRVTESLHCPSRCAAKLIER